MSVVDIEHLLHNIYERQAHLLKALEERYTGRPIYEEPISFDSERGEIQSKDGKGKPKSRVSDILPLHPINEIPVRTSKESRLSLEEQFKEQERKEHLKKEQEDLENELKEEMDGKGKSKKWIQEATKKMKKGAFTKQALHHHETPEEFAEEVMEHPKKYTKTTRKRAQFLKNITGKGAEVKMPKKDYMAEHHSLIKMLEEISSKAGKEAKKQSKEIKGKGKKCINNIKGGCGECGGTDGKLIV